MKIMIMTDMEGVAGILNRDWTTPGGRYYDRGRQLLTDEVNSAIDGFFAAGASEVVIVDGHGPGGLDPERLDERALFFRGHYYPIWPWGMDRSFNALAFVGQHAKAGTPNSHLTHTGSFDVIDLSVNGLSIGEYGQLALCARELGVPTILACGEEAFCREAEALAPGVYTVSGKSGVRPDDGMPALSTEEYSFAKLAAVHRHPNRVRRDIRMEAERALKQLKKNPDSFQYIELQPPYSAVQRYRHTAEREAYQTEKSGFDSFIDLINSFYH